jgi:hypothetical protein
VHASRQRITATNQRRSRLTRCNDAKARGWKIDLPAHTCWCSNVTVTQWPVDPPSHTYSTPHTHLRLPVKLEPAAGPGGSGHGHGTRRASHGAGVRVTVVDGKRAALRPTHHAAQCPLSGLDHHTSGQLKPHVAGGDSRGRIRHKLHNYPLQPVGTATRRGITGTGTGHGGCKACRQLRSTARQQDRGRRNVDSMTPRRMQDAHQGRKGCHKTPLPPLLAMPENSPGHPGACSRR